MIRALHLHGRFDSGVGDYWLLCRISKLLFIIYSFTKVIIKKIPKTLHIFDIDVDTLGCIKTARGIRATSSHDLSHP